ncbi:glycosyltransferase [Allomesorhizobium camelthorni]|uniref:Glycosyltransferase n=1 Tax=Allomesorhizobium camelthorni TaxID=475069 RepID=A0A6G4WPS1_9HYPH|nr:glycosyltransferase [Mesorhizobium camelthorni]NGO56110.1 glycosyltransferase [Mesorhizobium camelthorni]
MVASLISRAHTRSSTEPPDVVLAKQLASGIKSLKLGFSDRILFHTADGMTYAAIDRFLAATLAADAPRLHVCTPYDPTGIMPNRVRERPIDQVINRWRDAGFIGNPVYLHAENARLATHLSSLWGLPVGTLPLPLPEYEPAGAITDRPSGEGHALRVAHLGPARIEKGFHLLPKIVEHALNELGWSNDSSNTPIKFFIQTTPQVVGYTPQVAEALTKLKGFPENVVRLIDKETSEAEYLALAQSCDVFLLPYGVHEYKYRSSGIVSEAVSLGKVIVATDNTYPASMIGSDAGVAATTVREFGSALAKISRNIEKYRLGAISAALHYRAEFAAKAYVDRCLEAERLGRTMSQW